MGNKRKLKKIHTLAIFPIKILFIKNRKSKTALNLGRSLYKIGTKFFINRIRKIKNIITIYSKTDMYKEFIPGISDIDFVIIIKDTEINSEIKTIKHIYTKWAILRVIFPFISPPKIYTINEFKDFQNKQYILRRNIEDWKILYGKDIRSKKIKNSKEISRYELRWAFENLLLNIYENQLNLNNYLRRTYKMANYIIKTGMIKNKTIAKLPEEFHLMPSKDFKISKENQIKLLFAIIKTLELLEKKRNILKNKKTYISEKIPIKNKPKYSYFIIKTENYKKFRKDFLNTINKIQHMREFIKTLKKNPKSRFGTEFKTFPLILSKKLINSEFIGSFYPYELTNKNKNEEKASFKIFKENILSEQIYSFTYRSILEKEKINKEIIDYVMAYRLLNEKNKIQIKDMEKEYGKEFGAKIKKRTSEETYKEIRRIMKK